MPCVLSASESGFTDALEGKRDSGGVPVSLCESSNALYGTLCIGIRTLACWGPQKLVILEMSAPQQRAGEGMKAV